MKNKTIISFFLLIIILACSDDDSIYFGEEVSQVEIDASSYVVDKKNNLILFNGKNLMLELPEVVIDGEKYLLESTDKKVLTGKKYTLTSPSAQSYAFYKTELPIVRITTTEGDTIPDEPKIPATISIIDSGAEISSGHAGVELRGFWSQTYPKKSYSVELWTDASGITNRDDSFFGMRNDDDWILDGLWNEPLRLRDYVSHGLWLDIARYPYRDEEKDITLGIKREFCEVFLNDEYRGVYYLGEKIDRKQLALKKFQEGQLGGELFKNAEYDVGVLYKELQDFSNDSLYWIGYETKYPDEVGQFDWTNLHDFKALTIENKDASVFENSIPQMVDLENMADYFILINVIYASDNYAKNFFTARYSQESPYFFVAWDMDATFGNDWRGDRKDITDRLISNPFYDKLLIMPDFKTELVRRWNDLRKNTLQVSNLQMRFKQNYDYLQTNGVYEREALDETLPLRSTEEELPFINSWIERHMTFLDGYFASLSNGTVQ